MPTELNSVDLAKLQRSITESTKIVGDGDTGLRGDLRRFIKLHNDTIAGCRVQLAQQVSVKKCDALLHQWAMTDRNGQDIHDTLSHLGTGTVSFGGNLILRDMKAQAQLRPEIDAEAGVLLGIPPTSGYADDPVCTANGNFVHQETDLQMAGYATSIASTRTYNAMSHSAPGKFGLGWSSLLDIELVDIGDAKIVVRLDDGAHIVFNIDEDGQASNNQRDLTLRQHKAGWKLERSDQSWNFNQNGTHTGGSLATSIYTIDHQLNRVIVEEQTTGRSIVHSLNLKGLVQQSTTSDGRAAQYSYNDDGQCIRAETPSGSTSYELEEGQIAAVIDADGIVLVRNTYDATGRVSTQTVPSGRTSYYEYRDNGTTKIQYGEDGPTNLYTHDRLGNLTAMYGGDGAAMRFKWDSEGRLAQSTSRGGQRLDYNYDQDLNTPNAVISNGVTIDARIFDEQGRIASESVQGSEAISYGFTGQNPLPATTIGPDGSTIEVEYNESNQPVSITDSDGVSKHLLWNADGQLAAVHHDDGTTTEADYDPLGRLTSIDEPDGARTEATYNEQGLIEKLSRSGQRCLVFAYTPAGRLSTVTSENGTKLWTLRYNAAGLASEIVDVAGAAALMVYDHDGRITESITPAGEVTNRTFDTMGRLTSETNALGHGQHYIYGPTGVLTSVTDPEGNEWVRTVDEFGRTNSLTTPSGSQHRWTYHRGGRLAAYLAPDGSETHFEVDGYGRVTHVADSNGQSIYRYSPSGRLLEVSTPAGRKTTWGGTGYQAQRFVNHHVELFFEPDGRLSSWNWAWPPICPVNEFQIPPSTVLNLWPVPDFKDLVGGFDNPLEQALRESGIAIPVVDLGPTTTPSPIRQLASTIGLGQVAAGSGPNYAALSARAAFDERGLLRLALTAGGATSDYLSDIAGRLTTIRSADTFATYRRDRAGRVIEIETGHSPKTQIDYDGCNRVARTSVSSGQDCTFGYDQEGRLLSAESSSETYRFTYDATGQLVSASDESQEVTVEWASTGRIASVVAQVGSATTYSWDPDGLLAALDLDGYRIEYRRDPAGGLIAMETEASGTVELPSLRSGERDHAGRLL